jgi:hypothetical protein
MRRQAAASQKWAMSGLQENRKQFGSEVSDSLSLFTLPFLLLFLVLEDHTMYIELARVGMLSWNRLPHYHAGQPDTYRTTTHKRFANPHPITADIG